MRCCPPARLVLMVGIAGLGLCTGCIGLGAAPTPRVDYALVIHGGAGVIARDKDPTEVAAYQEALERALRVGLEVLEAGGTSLDAVEKTVRSLEDDPLFNAGRGAVYTSEGTHELDAAIMDGRGLDCGAVSGVKTIKNPISLARRVMENSRHVFLVGAGAEAFAAEHHLARVGQEYFSTERRHEQWQRKREEQDAGEPGRSTVGCVALDGAGNLAAATSTGGLTNKRFGRVGDVPIIGAGTYAKNGVCAVSCTGIGEQFIRNTVARNVAALMEYRGLDLHSAAHQVIDEQLRPGDGGLIAVSSAGELVWAFNSEGMFRGAADSSGRFEVAIWEDR